MKTKVYRVYANDTMWETEIDTWDGAHINTVAKEDVDGRPYTEMTITAEDPERELRGQISDGLGENLLVTKTVEEHRYGMRLRGFGPGCQPMRGLIDGVEASGKYWAMLTYNRKLTPEEIRDYELDELEGGE